MSLCESKQTLLNEKPKELSISVNLKRFADVVVALPVEGEFTYEVPEAFADLIAVGKRVLVPFGKRMVTGYVVGLRAESDFKKPKSLADVLDDKPLFDLKKLKFLRWLSSYYLVPQGEVLKLIHPSALNIKSQRFFSLSEKGLELVSNQKYSNDLSDESIKVLSLIKNEASLSVLAKRVKSAKVKPGSLSAALARLKTDGLVREEVRLNKTKSAKTEKIVFNSNNIDMEVALHRVARYPVQKALLDYLNEHGETSLKKLRQVVSESSDAAVRSLEKKGFVVTEVKKLERDPFGQVTLRASDFAATEEQVHAIDRVAAGLDKGFSPFLLHGITGSGKTFVYLKIIEKVIKSGRQALVLVPEIALTHTLSGFLAGRFPGRVALVHSALSDGERYDQWQRVLTGEADVVIGARSALFAPLERLGIIIVDEEHDPSYKQEEGIRYNARDSAMMLAKQLGITVVLGSATPSVETFYNTQTGRLTILSLKKRVAGGVLPDVTISSMKGARSEVFSPELSGLMQRNLDSGEQTLLFLNRRGFSNFLICRDCGKSINCLNCTVSLTLHKEAGRLRCHYCDFELPVPESCPECRVGRLANPGMGTEKVMEAVSELFPQARLARLDRDTVKQKGELQRIMDSVEHKEVDVLIGTQMVSKGHHFPGITLVGIVNADTALNLPEFRASERTFQLISQASGRAGREGADARVVIQTLDPGSACLRYAAAHDYEGFFENEVRSREDAGYPPFYRLATVRIDGVSQARVERAGIELRDIAHALNSGSVKVTALGPVPCVITKIKGRHRMQMLCKARQASMLNHFLRELKARFLKAACSGVSILIDVDPMTTI